MTVRVSDFAIRRPVFTLVTMVLVLLLGAVSLMYIPLKLLPDINPPVGVVVTTFPGASPEEIVEKVSKPLEESLATLPGIKTVTSTSQESASFILLQFSWSTDIEKIQDEIIQRMDLTVLPEEAQQPRFLKFDPAQFPIIQLSLRGNEDEQGLRELAESLKTELSKVDGIASVNLSGTLAKEVKVQLDQEQLEYYHLSQGEIADLIKANHLSLPASPVVSEEKELTTRILALIDSIETLKGLTVTVDPFTGEPVLLEEISEIEMVRKDDRTITRTNQQPSVLLSVLQQSDANTALLSTQFIRELNDLLKRDRYSGIQAEIIFDQGDYIDQAIGNISDSLILGGLFAMVVLFLFLRNVKSPFIIGISIPYSVIFTFVLMYFAGFTLNVMTLGGLALGIGMLVDNSIVVIENIYRHLSMGKEAKIAARDGSREVGAAITASTLTTVAVFLPVAFISGIIGELFKEFALTISFSLLASLLVSLTVVPMLASKLLKAPKEGTEERRQQSWGMRQLESSVRWSLVHRYQVLLLSILLFGVGIYSMTTVGTQFLPNTDEGFFTVRVKLEHGSPLTETNQVLQEMENLLKQQAEVDTYVSLIGTTQEGTFRGTKSSNEAEIYVKMKPLTERNRSTFRFVDSIKKKMKQVATRANQSAVLSFQLQSTTGQTPNTLTFSVRDSNPKRLETAVHQIEKKIATLSDVTEFSHDLNNQVQEIQLLVNRDNALQQGFVPATIALAVGDVTRGRVAAKMINQEGEVLPIRVEYDPSITKDIDSLGQLLLKRADGEYITLQEVVEIVKGEGPVSIQRINQQSAVQFTVKYKDTTNLGFMGRKVDKAIATLELDEETEIFFSGDRELLESALDQMVLAFILAISFVYLVMAAQFESLKYPLVIMFTVPLMVIGIGISLVLTDTPIGLTVIIGVIVLSGIVVNNAIVIVDYINQKKAMGFSREEAIVTAVKERVRPIFMTALTTMLGLVPLALGLGEGTEMNQPMGITVIGGLLSSTLLTLLVIPVVYSLFDRPSTDQNTT